MVIYLVNFRKRQACQFWVIVFLALWIVLNFVYDFRKIFRRADAGEHPPDLPVRLFLHRLHKRYFGNFWPCKFNRWSFPFPQQFSNLRATENDAESQVMWARFLGCHIPAFLAVEGVVENIGAIPSS
jgi:hypothetical protein